MINIIDPHVHFIDLNKGNYFWLHSENEPFWPDKPKLFSNVTPSDFSLSEPLILNGLVHIEAGFDNENPSRELDYVQTLLNENSCIPIRTVAFADLLATPDVFLKQIEELNEFKTLQGIRYILDEKLEDIFSFSHIKDNLDVLANHNLHFELQADFTSLQSDRVLRQVLEALPQVRLAVNHAGFIPLSKDNGNFQKWFDAMMVLREVPDLLVKVSGLEMVKRTYSQSDFEFAIEQCVNIFSENNVGIASNYPVMKLSWHENRALSYQQYWSNAINALNKLTLPIDKLVYSNTAAFYQFN